MVHRKAAAAPFSHGRLHSQDIAELRGQQERGARLDEGDAGYAVLLQKNRLGQPGPLEQGVGAGIAIFEIARIVDDAAGIAVAPLNPNFPAVDQHAALPAGFSSNRAIPCPPPMHAEAIPYRSRERISSRASVVVSRIPVAARGWPMAMAPPLTLTLSRSSCSSRSTAMICAAKASLISKRSMEFRPRPVASRSLRMAVAGPRPIISGGTPTVAAATMRARDLPPRDFM